MHYKGQRNPWFVVHSTRAQVGKVRRRKLYFSQKSGANKQRDDRIRKMFIVRKGIITKPNKDDPDAKITGSDILGKGRVPKPHLTPQVTCGFRRGGAALQGGYSHWH